MSIKTLPKIALLVVSSWLAGSLQALPDDPQQPLHISADSATRDERSGTTEYLGEVIITQGSLRIEADSVLITQQGKVIQQVQARGNPAVLSQQPSLDAERIRAQGGRIDYNPHSGHLLLLNSAVLEQQGSKVQSDRIEYDLNRQRIEANGNSNRGERVEVVVMPAPPAAVEPKPVDTPLSTPVTEAP